VKHPRRNLLALALFAPVAFAAIGCGGIATPQGWASPTFDAEAGLLLASHRDDLFAFDPETFRPKWAFPPQEPKIDKVVALYGTPAIVGTSAFIPTYDGHVYAVSTESGDLLWSQPFDAGDAIIGGIAADAVTGAVASDDAAIYFGTDGGDVYAVSQETGEALWQRPFKADEKIWSRPAVAGDALYVTSLDSKLYVLDRAAGTERDSFKTDAGIAADPVVDEENGLVYIGGFDGQLRAIDIDTFEELWSIKTDNWFWATPLLADGVVYAAGLDKSVYALDAKTGDLKWQQPFEAKGPVRAAPVLVRGMLIVADKDARVYALDPATGAPSPASPLDLGGDALADPLALGAAPEENVVIVTTNKQLTVFDPETLRIVREIRLGS